MKRLLTLLALAGLSAAAGACGDDSGDDGDDKGEVKTDAAVKADAKVIRPTQIDNLAATCEANGDCKGVGAVECLTEFGSEMFGGTQELEGGYCTAACNDTLECGANGACPVADLVSNPQIATILNLFGGTEALSGIIPQNCIATCTVGDAGGQGTCARADHLCRKLIPDGEAAAGAPPALAGALAGLPGLQKTYCLPEIDIQLGDAGIRRDGGAALRVSGLDAGI
ncbi:MAG TPA: hypothetical protein VFX59_23155 [Polyangiales bacterium]|nr:hypothetical protein [Polyangiales bacterium]